MRKLLEELEANLNQGRPYVYCSLIETRGSTPQKAGAAMLIYPDGSQSGTLGGGCVEAEVKQRALRLLGAADATSQVLTFNLDDNYGWDDGLICGGRMQILADPHLGGPIENPSYQDTAASEFYGRYRQLLEEGSGCTEAAVYKENSLGLAVGSRFLFDAEGELIASVPPGKARRLAEALKPVRSRPKPYTAGGVAYLPHWPRITVLIVGGGHVGLAVARLAADVDFDIWVIDDREMYVSAERFPMAEKRIVGDIGRKLEELVGSSDIRNPTPAQAGAKTRIDPSFFCLIVTRGHNHDEEALYHLAGSEAGYVGMIGSKRKIKLIFEDLLARGVSRENLQKVHAPLGFDIGSKTVPEIAVSIVAELIACRNLGATIPAARSIVHPPSQPEA